MARSTLHLRYLHGDASGEDLKTVVDEVLEELADPNTEAAMEARIAGLDYPQLEGASVSVDEEQQGAEPILTTILIGITVTAGSHVAERLWDDVIWPRVKRRLGGRALGRQDE